MDFRDLVERIERVLLRHGVSQKSAHIVAEVVAAAERDGTRSHGLIRLEGYVSSLKSGWIDGAAVPLVRDAAPGLVAADARNGFAQVALAESRSLLIAKARAQGIAALVVRNSHHFASLWPDVEGFAEEGFIALTMINTRSYMSAWGGTKKILGTNPMAFACPRKRKPPVVWDQASARISHGDLLLAVKDKKELELGVGVDANGNATVNPRSVLEGGALLAFGGHKGSAIAFMVEILAAAATGGRFGFDDRVADFPGGKTSHAGQFVLLLDPVQTAGEEYFERVEEFLERLKASGTGRLPGDRRYERRARAARDGIPISAEQENALQTFAR